MYKLGDQWIEIIDGQEHMKKCVGLADDMSEVVKDLGILKNGMLPCFHCGKYDEVTQEGDLFFIAHKCSDHFYIETDYYRTEQETKDAWNRRA